VRYTTNRGKKVAEGILDGAPCNQGTGNRDKRSSGSVPEKKDEVLTGAESWGCRYLGASAPR